MCIIAASCARKDCVELHLFEMSLYLGVGVVIICYRILLLHKNGSKKYKPLRTSRLTATARARNASLTAFDVTWLFAGVTTGCVLLMLCRDGNK